MNLSVFIDRMLTDLSHPTYAWDDWDCDDNWMWDPPDGFLDEVSDAAKVALTLATAIWIMRRFASLDTEATPSQIVQAGWAYLINPEAAIYYETDWEDWLGPVRGPLGLVCDITMDVLFTRDANPDLGIRAFWMANLARYVLGHDAAVFDAWFTSAYTRLAELHPRSQMPVPDLFDPFPPLHPVVGQGVMVPDSAYDPSQARAELLEYLFAGARDNPFITYAALTP